MYIKRLVETTCQLPEPPEHMFAACHYEKNVKILGFCSKLILDNIKHTTILIPCSVSYFSKKIVMPQYWVNSDTSHSEVTFESGIGEYFINFYNVNICIRFRKLDNHGNKTKVASCAPYHR